LNVDFTGIDSAYEEPHNPEIVIETGKLSIEQSVAKIVEYLDNHGVIKNLNKSENFKDQNNDTSLEDMLSRELFITNPQEALDLKEKAIRYYRLNINKVIFQNIFNELLLNIKKFINKRLNYNGYKY